VSVTTPLERLRALLGPRATDAAAVREHHSHGESYHPPAAPDIVCFPISTAEVVEVYASLFLKAPRVVYLGDTRHKGGYQNRDLMRELNLPIQVTANLPDVILLCELERYLVVAEVVASSGPVSTARLAQLQHLVQQAQTLGYRLRYVSAFPSRRVFRRFVEDIAWGTQVWIANEAEQVINFGTTS